METEITGIVRRLKLVVLCVYLLFFSIGVEAQSSISIATGPQEDVVSRKEVLDHVRRLLSALLERDSVALLTLLADDVKYGHSNGLTQNKDEVIRSVMSGQHDYRSITTREEELRVYGSSAVVNLSTAVSMVLEGNPIEMDLNILMVWIREGIGWKLVARQSVRRN